MEGVTVERRSRLTTVHFCLKNGCRLIPYCFHEHLLTSASGRVHKFREAIATDTLAFDLEYTP